MPHGSELTVVTFLCVALALGAITRICGRSLRLPYTVIVLLIGCAIGVALGQIDIEQTSALLGRLDSGTQISSDVIIFIFLPALIFESAYALDVHAFRRELAGVAVLAVPALLVSTAAVGGLMYILAGYAWGWSLLAALVFGALISATDPVAVVAILRETRSPKRLGVLIEGESLLNDGTAIVVFSALLAMLASPGSDIELGSRVVRFVWVVGGGVGVGLALAMVVSAIVGRVFNDALVEITLTIVTAYASMLIAEAALHVSGVMAIVAAGLWLGGPGRTRISPEVRHFLHQFWEMVSYLANTMIFFLVGLVVAAHWQHAEALDFLRIIGAYVGVMVIRFVIMFAFRPIMGLVAEPVSVRATALLSWGGLRGAVSLALALIVSRQPDLSPVLRQQILLVTTGVVVLTILINGSTVAWLLERLGLTKLPIGERVAGLTTTSALLTELGDDIGRSRYVEELCMAPWDDVIAGVCGRARAIDAELDSARDELAAAPHGAAGYWQQALAVERRAYWGLYARGLLDGGTAQRLDRDIAQHIDRVRHGQVDPPESRLPKVPAWRKRLTRTFRFVSRMEYSRLLQTYEIARAQAFAAQSVLHSLEHIADSDSLLEPVIATYEQWRTHGKTRVEHLRAALPEVVYAIENRLARRIGLNMERAKYEELVERGTIDSTSAQEALVEIQRHMKRLHHAPRHIPIPETATIVARLPLFAGLPDDELSDLAEITEEHVFEADHVLIEEGEAGDSMYVIARGAVHVVRTEGGREVFLDVLGGGEIVGEMSLLTDQRRTATVRCATTVTVGRVTKAAFNRLMESRPGLRDRIWQRFAAHQFDNLSRGERRFAALDHNARRAWLASADAAETCEVGATFDVGSAAFLYLVAGAIEVDNAERKAPLLLECKPSHSVRATAASRIIRLPPPPEGREPKPE